MRKDQLLRLLIFDMSEDKNEGSRVDDEGYPADGGVRRVKSTPNLLQLPSLPRSRKKSDDSAVGSGEEESESDKSTPSGRSPERLAPFHRTVSTICSGSQGVSPTDEGGLGLLPSSSSLTLLRPPSVVVSDHDLAHTGPYLTLEDLDADYFAQQYRNRRRLSDTSTCSSFSELDVGGHFGGEEQEAEESCSKVSKWRAIRSVVHFTPFIQTYKNDKKTKYPWVQLAGHQGNFKAGWQQGTILKKYSQREMDAFERLKEDDPILPFVPQYYGVVKEQDCDYIQLEDLLGRFDNPCVMDCKLGVRTYLEEELMKAKEKPKLRKDMYEKMCQIDPNAPTPEEHRMHGVTKPRYMVWRETISTTATLGFRIEGVRKSDGSSSKDFKTIRSKDKVLEAFEHFVEDFPGAPQLYLDRLYDLYAALSKSQFFASHEVIGSSLLFVHDSMNASVWMIDFAKTIPLPEGINQLGHDKPWSPGNHEDGYLTGLSNLISIFQAILQKR